MKNIPKIIPVMYAKALKDGTLAWGEECVSATNDFEEDDYMGVALVRLSDVAALSEVECENCNQLVRALREAVEGPTFMGEPVFILQPPTAEPGQTNEGVYVSVNECRSCGHIGINDSHDTEAACNECGWHGISPKEDRCPECHKDGTMSSACPKCCEHYSCIADATIKPRTVKEREDPLLRGPGAGAYAMAGGNGYGHGL